MTKSTRELLGAGCLLLSVVPTYAFYAASEGTSSWNPGLLLILAVGASLSFGMFMLCGRSLASRGSRWALGGLGSYMVMVTALLIFCWATGELEETLPWMPILLLFGIPRLAPLVVLTGAASFLFLPARRDRE